jgi:hypothetical protein
MVLQCPHHGAKNLINTVLPAVALSHVSGVSSTALAHIKLANTSSLDMAAEKYPTIKYALEKQ